MAGQCELDGIACGMDYNVTTLSVWLGNIAAAAAQGDDYYVLCPHIHTGTVR